MSDVELQNNSYISADDIAARVGEIGSYLTEKFGDEEVVAITMMNGAKVFATDLTRAINNVNLLDDNMRVSSYESTESKGEVQFHYDSLINIKDRNVLLIEDILDTGTTLSRVIPQLWSRKPKSITVACMFEKPSKRQPGTDFKVDDLQIGMRIADKFILGYGLDWKDPDGISRYRNLPYVTVAKFVKIRGEDWVVPENLPDNVL
jgi:hypoxanthine phosphoribosyltransferase